MATKYVCPHCGAMDSTKCSFPITLHGQVKLSHVDEAKRVGCRVLHYTERFKATGSYDD